MATTKIPGKVAPDEYHFAYGLSPQAEEKIIKAIHEDINEQLAQKSWDMLMSFASLDGEPQFWITVDSPDGGFNFTINDEECNNLDWFVDMVMEAINDECLHSQYKSFLTQTAKAFGFLAEAATKKLQEIASETNG